MGVAIKYKGSQIASMDESGTKTLNTAGKYCEDDFTVDYTADGGGTPVATRGKVFERVITASEVNTGSYAWITLVDADEDILAHKDDATLCVSFHIVQSPGAVSAIIGGVSTASPLSNDSKYGIVIRQTSAGAQSPSSLSAGLRSGTASTGVLHVTDAGGVRIYQATSYPMRAGTYIVSVSW